MPSFCLMERCYSVAVFETHELMIPVLPHLSFFRRHTLSSFPLNFTLFSCVGRVFKAKYCGVKIALKEIFVPDNKQERHEVLLDFEKELRVLSCLRHPRIITFYGSVRSPPHFCLLTELMSGSVSSLLKLVRTRKARVTWGILFQGRQMGPACSLQRIALTRRIRFHEYSCWALSSCQFRRTQQKPAFISTV